MIHRVCQLISTAIVSGLLFVATESTVADNYKLDASHTAIVFKIQHITIQRAELLLGLPQVVDAYQLFLVRV